VRGPGLAEAGIKAGKTNLRVISCGKINGCYILKEEMGLSLV